ncbi:MAG: hypothetical protein AB7G04_12700 [Hyphomonadaceae bacterium]
MPDEKPTPEETPDPAALGAGHNAPQPTPDIAVLQAAPAPSHIQGDGGLRNIHPGLDDDNAILVEARRPSAVGRALAAALVAVIAIGGAVGFVAWRNQERAAARVAALAPQAVQHATPAPEEQPAPEAQTFAAPYGGSANDPALRQEIDNAWAVLRAAGVQAPTLAEGVHILAMQVQAQARAQAQARVTPAAAAPTSAALPATDCPATADANVIGVVYFEAGSVRLDAVDVAALRAAMQNAQGRALEIRGAADVAGGEPAAPACADAAASPKALLACQRAAAVAGELARIAPGQNIAAAAAPALETIQPRRCARRAEIRLL